MLLINRQTEKFNYLKEKSKQFEEEGYPFKNRFVLLTTSYCSDNPECFDFRPCLNCLQMCNIGILENDQITAIVGYDYLKDVKCI